MTVEAIARLSAFNLLLAVVGAAVLFALRPATTRRDFLRLAGVSYLLGVAGLMLVLTLFIVVGVPVTSLSIVLVASVILVAGGAVGRRRRRLPPDSGPPGSARFLSISSAAVLALTAVCLEAVFRKGRLQGLIEFDGWDSWGPKTKALYHFDHLDPTFLHGLPGGSYPPGLPAVLASALHAIGSADMVTLHLQYWFFGLGFVAALVGLLANRVKPLLLLPFALLVFVIPDIRSRSVDMYGDLPLGFPIAIAALLIALWLDRRRAWHLPAAALILASAVLTKREGVLLAACVVLAGLVASLDRIRIAWPRLLAVFAGAFAAWLPWQIWLAAKGLPANGPEGGLDFVTDVGRGWNSFVAVTKNLFDYDLRLLSTTIAIAAVGLCLLARAWRMAAYLGSLIVFSTLACAAIIWSDPNLQLDDVNVVSRLVGGVTLTMVVLSPLALQCAWEAGGSKGAPASERAQQRQPGLRLAFAWAMVAAAAAIAYPATLLAEGGARFPQASDCVTAPTEGGEVMVVFGHVDSYPDALQLRDRAVRAGTGPVRVAQDGCGKVRVFVGALPSIAAAQEVARRARAAGLSPSLEAVSSD
jgi:hypothetical protein